MWSNAGGQQDKHVLYTLAQRALIELEDCELSVIRHPPGKIMTVDHGDLEISFPEGAVLFMTKRNQIGVHVHEGINVFAMLRAFHRYATRMIRLDV